MPLVTEHVESQLAAIRQFADSVGARERFEDQLKYLDTYGRQAAVIDHGGSGGPERRCVLYPDFAKHSLAFVMQTKAADGTWKPWFNGGLIYDGPGAPCDGSGPQFTVSLATRKHVHDWGVHT